jgi:hypothetical protein
MLAPSHGPADGRGAPARPQSRGRTGLPRLLRLLRLHLASRRVPAAVAALAVVAPLMQWGVRAILGGAGTPGAKTAAVQIALLLESMAAAVVSAAVHGPFGESERATGRLLPYLRAATALLLTGGALAALSLGAAGTGLPTGGSAMLRDAAGLVGIGLLGAAAVGGHFAWTGPAAYFVVAAYAVSDRWTTPWLWPARPAGDTGAALCAFGILLAAAVAITVKGPRDLASD